MVHYSIVSMHTIICIIEPNILFLITLAHKGKNNGCPSTGASPRQRGTACSRSDGEAERQEEPFEFVIPRSRHLFKTIESLTQVTHMMRKVRINHNIRLSHIDFLCNAPKIPYNFYNNFIICLGYKSSQMGIFRELIYD